MADRSFEQQVREELSGLRISPDDAVWTGIESALRKEKKRRFIWLLFVSGMFAGLIVAGYFYTTGRQDTSSFVKNNVQSRNSITLQHDSISQTTEGISEQQIHKEQITGASGKEQAQAVTTPIIMKPSIKFLTRKDEAISSNGNQPVVKGTVHSIKTKEADKLFSDKEDIAVSGQEKIVQPSVSSVESSTASKDSLVNEKISALLSQKTSDSSADKRLAVASAPDKKQISKSKKWQWSFHAAIGYGKPVAPFIIVRKTYTAANNSGLPATGGQLSNNTAEPVVQGKPALQAGMEISRPLGKKMRWGIVLDYQLYQTSTQTGSRVDSTAFFASYSAYSNNGYYYMLGSSSVYRSFYHMLYTGVNLYRNSRFFQLPSRWQAGMGVQMLVATNALLYDVNSGRLFSDNSLLAKIQPQVSLGFDVALGKHSGVYVGPSVQYTVSRLSRTGAADKHLFFAGAKLSWLLPEKKKKRSAQ